MRRDDERKQSQPGKLWRRRGERRGRKKKGKRRVSTGVLGKFTCVFSIF